MNTRVEGKASLVEFLRSIKFAQENSSSDDTDLENPTPQFAHFEPIARSNGDPTAEDSQLVRSAN